MVKTKVKTKKLRRKMTRTQKAERKATRDTVKKVGQGIVLEAIERTYVADPFTTHVWGPDRTPILAPPSTRTPRRGLCQAGWKWAARKVGIAFSFVSGFGLGSATLRTRKGRIEFKANNETPYAVALDAGGQLPPLPTVPTSHTVPAANIASESIRQGRRDFRRAKDEVWQRTIRKAWGKKR